jgi:transcriptional regulator with XRE-family HTH domain
MIFRGSDWDVIANPIRLDTYGGMKLFQKVGKILEDRGLKQADLAEMVGVSRQRISNWFAGTGQPNPDRLLRIARALGVTMEYLADEAMDTPVRSDLTEDQKLILQVIVDLGYTRAEVMRRLHASGDVKPEGRTYGGAWGNKGQHDQAGS